MDYWRREQVGAASGIVSVALFIVAGLLPGSYPQSDATAQEISGFFAGNRTEILWQTLLIGLGVATGVWFLGSLRALLRRAEGGAGRLSAVAYGSGLLLFGFVLLAQLFTVVPAYRGAADLTPELNGALYNLSAMCIAMGSFPLIAAAGATTLVLVRTEVLPNWVTALGALALAGGIFGAITLFYEPGSALAVGEDISYIVPFAGVSLLVLGASVAMMPALGRPEGMPHLRRRVSDIWTPEERERREAER